MRLKFVRLTFSKYARKGFVLIKHSYMSGHQTDAGSSQDIDVKSSTYGCTLCELKVFPDDKETKICGKLLALI